MNAQHPTSNIEHPTSKSEHVCMICGGDHDNAEDDPGDRSIWWGYCKACDCWTEHSVSRECLPDPAVDPTD